MTSIKSIKTTPLLVRDKVPYVWAQGVTYGAEVILIEIQTTDGVTVTEIVSGNLYQVPHVKYVTAQTLVYSLPE